MSREDMRHQLLTAAAYDEELPVSVDEASLRSMTGAALDVIGILLSRCVAREGLDLDKVVVQIRADLVLIDAAKASES